MIIPEKAVLRASQWCYRGIWAGVTQWMKVPDQPPLLRGADDDEVRAFRPAEGFLKYLKLYFWIGLTLFDGMLFIGWIGLFVAFPVVGLIVLPLVLAIMILPDIVAYIAIHLRYDTTWYVLSDRSMRIRRGIWFIHETTITYDNIQNVSIRQGPVQRHFGISDVVVETAGGGSGDSGHGNAGSMGHHGLLEGIGNAEQLRELILGKWRSSRSSGLGDDRHEHEPVRLTSSGSNAGFNPAHIEILEEIQAVARELVEIELASH